MKLHQSGTEFGSSNNTYTCMILFTSPLSLPGMQYKTVDNVLFYFILQHSDSSYSRSHEVTEYFSIKNVEKISLFERK
jgi:hypothetical protein